MLTALLWIGVGIMIGGPIGAMSVALCVMGKAPDPEPSALDTLQRVRRLQ
jgi:hypothetical protein